MCINSRALVEKVKKEVNHLLKKKAKSKCSTKVIKGKTMRQK
jgi:hypothetical protein